MFAGIGPHTAIAASTGRPVVMGWTDNGRGREFRWCPPTSGPEARVPPARGRLGGQACRGRGEAGRRQPPKHLREHASPLLQRVPEGGHLARELTVRRIVEGVVGVEEKDRVTLESTEQGCGQAKVAHAEKEDERGVNRQPDEREGRDRQLEDAPGRVLAAGDPRDRLRGQGVASPAEGLVDRPPGLPPDDRAHQLIHDPGKDRRIVEVASAHQYLEHVPVEVVAWRTESSYRFPEQAAQNVVAGGDLALLVGKRQSVQIATMREGVVADLVSP